MGLRKAAIERKLQRELIYVTSLGQWAMVSEVTGDERSGIVEQSMRRVQLTGNKTANKMDLKKYNPLLIIAGTYNPDDSLTPPEDHPHYADFFTQIDEDEKDGIAPGSQTFSDKDFDVVAKLGSSAQQQLSTAITRLCGMTQTDLDEKKDSSAKESSENGLFMPG